MKEYKVQSMFYDGNMYYHIERKIDGGEWKLLFGGMSWQEAHAYLDSPEAIESRYKFLWISGWVILAVFILLAGFLWFNRDII